MGKAVVGCPSWPGRRILATALAASLFIGNVQAQGSQDPHEFNIPAGTLESAIGKFGEQSGIQIIYDDALIANKQALAVRGQLDLRSGLSQLLRDTGLTWGFVNDTTVVIKRAPNLRPSSAPMPKPSESSTEPQEAEPATLEKITVTGTRIRGVQDLAAPSLTFTREDIDETGFTTVEGLFESIPQNFDGVTPDGRFSNEGGSFVAVRNNERAAAIDLRGLGPQSTLTLLNGTRRAGSVGGRVVDVSVIPLSVIDQVEVVTGGYSAIYGSDAVAGVVNLVTRRDFEGAETQVSYGTPTEYPGGERFQFSQIYGRDFGRGGFVMAYDYARDWASNLADTGLLSLANDPVTNITQLSLQAQTDTWRHSGFIAGRYALTDRIELHADGLYTYKKSTGYERRLFFGAVEESFTSITAPSRQYSGSVGTRVDLGRDWTLSLTGAASVADNLQDYADFVDTGSFVGVTDFQSDNVSSLNSLSVVADGPIFSIGGITPRTAFGVEFREEEFENVQVSSGAIITDFDRDRRVRSAFGELLVPFAQGSSRAGMRRLDVSLAARYDEYSDFGSTFNPQFGVSWEPVEALTLRGAYSTAFRAPSLIDLGSSVGVFLQGAPDPMRGDTQAPILFMQGDNPDLGPEEAVTWSFGFDYKPTFAPGTKVSLSYFSVDYDERLEQPMANHERRLALEREARFPGLINRHPTPDDVAAFLARNTREPIFNGTGTPWDPETQDLLDVFPDLILIDNRINNIAIETVRGLDLRVDTEFDSQVGTWNFGLDATYTLDHERKITPTSPAVSLLNEVGKPVDLRARARAGWTQGAYSTFLYVNYVDDYVNPFTADYFANSDATMASWTTVDLTLRMDGSQLASRGLLSGFSAAFSVSNLFDKAPPRFSNSFQGLLYDSANANPVGRYVSLRLTKNW